MSGLLDHRAVYRWGPGVLAAAAAVLLAVASPRMQGLLANTALLAAGALGIALPLGVFLGVVLAKTDLPARRTIGWLLAGFLFVPLYVQAAAWNAVLGTGGWIPRMLARDGHAVALLSEWRGAIWVHSVGAVPWVALLTAGGLAAVERRLEEESLLDASSWRVLWRVSLRRGGAGTAAAAVWVAVICATEIAVTDLYQVRTFAEEVYTQASLGILSAGAGALAASDLAIGVALLAVLGVLALGLMLPWLPAALTTDDDRVWKWQPARSRILLIASSGLLAALLVLPLAALVWKCGVTVVQQGDGYVRSWSPAKAASMILESPWEHRREWAWSLATGSIAALAATTLGLAGAWLARLRPRAVPYLLALIAAAIAAPAPLWGVWIIRMLNHPEGSWLSPLTVLYDRTLLAPVLAQTIRGLPLVALWLGSQFASVPQDLLESARVEGATAVQRFFYVALPLRRRAVLGTVVMALILSLGELSATLLVVPPGVTPISVRVFQLLHYGVDDRVAALSLSIFAALGVAIAAGSAVSGGRGVR